MRLSTRYNIVSTLLSCALSIATLSTQAAPVSVTVQGTLVSVSDPDNLLTFVPPAIGSSATYYAVLDETAPSGYDQYKSGELSFGNQYYDGVPSFHIPGFNLTGATSGVRIANDMLASDWAYVDSEFYSPTNVGMYIDIVNIFANQAIYLDNRPGPGLGPLYYEFGLAFESGADATPVSPLTDTQFHIPDPNDWQNAFIYFSTTGNTIDTTTTPYSYKASQSFLTFQIDSVTVTPVPVPATIWLFGSALLGFTGFKRPAV